MPNRNGKRSGFGVEVEVGRRGGCGYGYGYGNWKDDTPCDFIPFRARSCQVMFGRPGGVVKKSEAEGRMGMARSQSRTRDQPAGRSRMK